MTKARVQPAVEHCCYPGCVLNDEHDGDHRLTRRPSVPFGELRLLQIFSGCSIREFCQLDPDELHRGHGVAVAYYADEQGFGWTLCRECSPRPIERPVAAAPALAKAAAPPKQPKRKLEAPLHKADVIEMRRR
jgi:hypothetical protein